MIIFLFLFLLIFIDLFLIPVPQYMFLEKNARRSTSGKEEIISSKSSLICDETPIISDVDKVYAFIGYNLSDSIVHVSGDVAYMFPHDGSLIKVNVYILNCEL